MTTSFVSNTFTQVQSLFQSALSRNVFHWPIHRNATPYVFRICDRINTWQAMLQVFVLLILVSLSISSACSQTNYVVRFNSTNWDPNFTLTRPSTAFGYGDEDNVLTLSKTDGPINGRIAYRSTFALRGDFEITVTATRINGPGSSGLAVDDGGLVSADVYFTRTQLGASKVASVAGSFYGYQDGGTTIVFRIRRINGNLVVDFNSGNTWKPAGDRNSGANDFFVELFLSQEDVPGSALATKFSFDDLAIQAEAIIDRRSPLFSVGIINAIALSFPTDVGKRYQAQFRRAVDADDSWLNLGAIVDGTGLDVQVYDAVNAPKRFYRVVGGIGPVIALNAISC